jgi:ferritin-like metal-binding protein YciE
VNARFTDKSHEIFVTGLRNAHAMKNEALGIMKPQLSRIENYPEVAARLNQHIRETEAQLERLEGLLEDMGETSSTFKDTALSVMGRMAAMGHTMADDEILKNSFANFAFENFEIAAYNSLLTLADAGGLAQQRRCCGRTSPRKRTWPSGCARTSPASPSSMRGFPKPGRQPRSRPVPAGAVRITAAESIPKPCAISSGSSRAFHQGVKSVSGLTRRQ